MDKNGLFQLAYFLSLNIFLSCYLRQERLPALGILLLYLVWGSLFIILGRVRILEQTQKVEENYYAVDSSVAH